MSVLDLYLLLKLDVLKNLSGNIAIFLLILSGLLVFIITIICSDFYGREDFKETWKGWVKFFKVKLILFLSIFLLVLDTLLPTTKQAAFLYISPHIINNGEVQEAVKILPEIVKLGTDYLKEIIKGEVDDIKQD